LKDPLLNVRVRRNSRFWHPRRGTVAVDVIEQRLDEKPEARAHSDWQFKISHVPHPFTPTTGVPCDGYSRKSQNSAHPDMQCFFVTPEGRKAM